MPLTGGSLYSNGSCSLCSDTPSKLNAVFFIKYEIQYLDASEPQYYMVLLLLDNTSIMDKTNG
jgi:hypothetical protein